MVNSKPLGIEGRIGKKIFFPSLIGGIHEGFHEKYVTYNLL